MFHWFILWMLVFLYQLACLTVDVSMHANTLFLYGTLKLWLTVWHSITLSVNFFPSNCCYLSVKNADPKVLTAAPPYSALLWLCFAFYWNVSTNILLKPLTLFWLCLPMHICLLQHLHSSKVNFIMLLARVLY